MSEETDTDYGEEEESSEEVDQDPLSLLKQWIETVPFLPQNLSEHMLTTFLDSTSTFDCAKEKITRFYRYRQDVSSVFKGRHPGCRYLERYSSVNVVPLTKPDTEDWVIFWCSLNDNNTSGSNIFHGLKLIFIEIDILLQEDRLRGKTVAFIFNMEHFCAAHLLKLTRYSCLVATRLLTDGFPAQLGSVYILNSNETVSDLTLLFPKLDFRILKDTSDLEKFIPKELIPNDVGGSTDTRNFQDLVDCYNDRLWSYGEFLAHEELLREEERIIRLCIEDTVKPKTESKPHKKKGKKRQI